jgi:hypothetical protein
VNGRIPQVTTPKPPPEARLITELREAKVPPLSMREAARRAGFSAPTWVQNEQGYRKVAPGVTIRIRATDEKLARMALVVGATPEQLEKTGRADAAVILQKLIDAGPDPVAQMAEVVRQSREFTDQQKQALIQLIERDGRSTG